MQRFRLLSQFKNRTRNRWQKRFFNFSEDRLYIDPGSSFTRIYLGKKLVFNEPTCIATHKISENVIAIGTKAASLMGKSGEQVKVSFPIQAGIIAQPKEFGLFLEAIYNHLFQKFSGWRYLFGTSSVWAMPGELSPVNRDYFDQIIKERLRANYQTETQMAAAAISLEEEKQNESLLVVAIGGQKTEMAVFTGGELVHARSFIWGGVELTETVQSLVRLEHSCALAWHVAEAVKKQVGVMHSPNFPLALRKERKISVRGKDLITQASKTVVISSKLFQESWRESASELLDFIQEFLYEVPTDVVTSALERGIYLTGGSSYLEGWSEFIQEELQSPVHRSPQPELDVIRGLVKMYDSA